MALVTGFRRYIYHRAAARARKEVQLSTAFVAEIRARRITVLAKPAHHVEGAAAFAAELRFRWIAMPAEPARVAIHG